MTKNPLLAFFLTFIPGAGHFYINRNVRGLLYGAGAILPFIFGFFLYFLMYSEQPLVIGIFIALIVTAISVMDMLLYLLKNKRVTIQTDQTQETLQDPTQTKTDENGRFYTILLSFIPGLGHFHLGLMNRGLTFLIGFFGLGTMVLFISVFTDQIAFLVFIGILPVLWVYNMFDAIQQVSKKLRGEELIDKTILEDFEETRREKGKKSKTLATLLSIFPGAGHMYLGLQKRGLQLMAAFLLGIYILDILRLSLFLFLIPIIWFYSFFDALQKVSMHGEEELEDIPVISYFVNHHKWLGIGMLALGLYYLVANVIIPASAPALMTNLGIDIEYWYYNYFQVSVICILLIGGGLKLMFGSKSRKESHDA
ncbi:multi-TM2 domain-containing protein [Lysinibacillus contaminans]|uniref:Multi-TM2 domain-containing protein n=1 Tax=Lysinibacillus contaminans TaxID=1293441 RepID=A0ABR5K4D7_9BACI|nr:hypothetical protein [Lysinibacillus contaminans]KOS69763.1 multi-TM2 domain-containing protein [Lysinibacillus contaminans]